MGEKGLEINQQIEQINFDEAFDHRSLKNTDKIFIFTPNGDFKNDELYVRGSIATMVFEVYNQRYICLLLN